MVAYALLRWIAGVDLPRGLCGASLSHLFTNLIEGRMGRSGASKRHRPRSISSWVRMARPALLPLVRQPLLAIMVA